MAPSIDIESPAPPIVPSKKSQTHPFSPLSAAEIQSAANVIKAQWPANTDVHFKCITLQEPPKSVVLPLLEAEHGGQTFSSPARKAFINYYIRNTVRGPA